MRPRSGNRIAGSRWDTTADALCPREPGGGYLPVQRGAFAAATGPPRTVGVGEHRGRNRSVRTGQQRSRGRTPNRGNRGAIDFVEAATHSLTGLRIIALPSTALDGQRSRIVPNLEASVTIPRGMVDVVVTEHGVAQLEGKTIRQRAEALIDVAAPQYRQMLGDALGQAVVT